MSYRNGIITEPVSMTDIQRALGLYRYRDIGGLITFGDINQWSYHKPICKATISGLDQENDLFNSNSGFTFDTTAQNPASFFNKFDEGTLFRYDRPRGGANQPFRMGDFRQYASHALARPWFTVSLSSSNLTVGRSTRIQFINEQNYAYARSVFHRERIDFNWLNRYFKFYNDLFRQKDDLIFGYVLVKKGSKTAMGYASAVWYPFCYMTDLETTPDENDWWEKGFPFYAPESESTLAAGLGEYLVIPSISTFKPLGWSLDYTKGFYISVNSNSTPYVGLFYPLPVGEAVEITFSKAVSPVDMISFIQGTGTVTYVDSTGDTPMVLQSGTFAFMNGGTSSAWIEYSVYVSATVEGTHYVVRNASLNIGAGQRADVDLGLLPLSDRSWTKMAGMFKEDTVNLTVEYRIGTATRTGTLTFDLIQV